jgi:cytochrome c556
LLCGPTKRGTHLRSGPKYGDGKASGDVWKVGEDFKTDRQKDKNTAKTDSISLDST